MELVELCGGSVDISIIQMASFVVQKYVEKMLRFIAD
jgi:hypothetical protein